MRGYRTVICVGAIVAASACSVAAAATPGSGTYKGLTSQKDAKSGKFQPVEVKVGSKGKRVKRIRIGFQTACADGTSYVSGFFVEGRPVGKGGQFSFASTYKPPDLNPGETADVFVEGKGRFTSAKKVKGSLDVQVNIFTAGKVGALKCKSGKVSFSAKR